ncbi:ribosomal-processing cysteine protease Prp [Hathewaya limosa]|uniref:Ribosomal processing cysteine protease Prp n=1 Tax=Hathewaya limosa TaxID=1536 RepID=A0ABU0JQZ9_HATLI|nr:ribosomal-processing cysteine protease Prp [Hathewaya limosa]AWZ48826.1 ribosomal-processing cysteine protease Prp [Clostridiaceae bacterium 14S0207]MDQ0479503.1 uncharacterized protein YsxB (DUF464 family) [Hathewaya limosa]
MITARFKRKHDNIVFFKISGHAGYADPGFDIICSSVSSISYTIANGITEILYIEPEIKVDENQGLMSLDLSHNSLEEIEKSQVLMKTMLLGIKSLEQLYGDYIKVIEEEV